MSNEIESKLLDMIIGIEDCSSNVENININSELTSIGIYSLSYIKLVADLESIYGFDFDDDKIIIKENMTIRDIADYIESKLPVEERIL